LDDQLIISPDLVKTFHLIISAFPIIS